MSKLVTAIIEPTKVHTATVIWLHGLGESGAGWFFLAEEFGPIFPHIKWILPDAPLISVTPFGDNNPVNAWFNIQGFEKSAHLEKVDEEGLMRSVGSVDQLIQDEIKNGIPSERIILGGFSQGCVISLLTAIITVHRLAGVVACSGWLALGEKLHTFGSAMNKQLPILICHGEEDKVVAFRFGKATSKYLTKKGYNVTFKNYPGLAHGVEPKELQDICHFISQRLPPNDQSSKL